MNKTNKSLLQIALWIGFTLILGLVVFAVMSGIIFIAKNVQNEIIIYLGAFGLFAIGIVAIYFLTYKIVVITEVVK